MEPNDLKKYSMIAPNAIVKAEYLEHPVHLAAHTQVHSGSRIGQFTFINQYSTVFQKVDVGRFCAIGKYCEIAVPMHPTDYLSCHSFQYSSSWFPNCPEYAALVMKGEHKNFKAYQPTKIGHDVWIGTGAIIKNGISIGNGAIIAAGSVVTKDVPDYAIVGGVPAKLIRMRFRDEIIRDLLELAWWNLELSDLKGLPFDDIEKCIALLKERKQRQASA